MRVTIWAARQIEKRHMRGLPWNTVWGPHSDPACGLASVVRPTVQLPESR